ncbi:unnamed protein product [Litomosoides sigmodontis]|uniref:Transcription factor AP-2 C-terminal domain-containing protein n=1 Tax=Litomosoides sigmodontis TaxID=42156 RepID=A0A3P6SJZ5_LITSI|nr:unnamed protein product [Litomosoides sigmodontis]
MGDRSFSDSNCNHGKDPSNLFLDRCSNSECNEKHCSRKRNFPFNSDVAGGQIRKQPSSENDELDIANNFLDEDDDSIVTEETDDKSCSNTLCGTHAVQTISSLFRNSNSENQKSEIGIGYKFHGHTAANFNTTTCGFPRPTDSTCHHYSQQLVYTGHMPVSSHYVISCTTVPVNSIGSNESSCGGASSMSVTTTTASDHNAVQSFLRSPFNSSTPTICNFGLSRTMYSTFGHSLPMLHDMPTLASQTFCAVPGRTSLLSSTTKYHVTTGEIYRRISPPECLNASLLGAILRKAKSKDGGKTLRDSLKRVGLILPAGRRKAATVTAWTALVEEEALQMAKDFAALSESTFPVREIAEFICNRMAWQDDPRECCTFIQHARLLIKELSEIVNGGHSGRTLGGNQSNPNALIVPSIQHGLAHFSLLTHGFGPLAFVAILDTLIAMLDEMLKCYNQSEQHFNVPLSEISVTHIPANRFIYNDNM